MVIKNTSQMEPFQKRKCMFLLIKISAILAASPAALITP